MRIHRTLLAGALCCIASCAAGEAALHPTDASGSDGGGDTSSSDSPQDAETSDAKPLDGGDGASTDSTLDVGETATQADAVEDATDTTDSADTTVAPDTGVDSAPDTTDTFEAPPDTKPVDVCGTCDEGSSITLTCPSGKISAIVFASYGTPTGTCGSFSKGSCDATTSVSVVDAACTGKTTCTVDANNGVFGDPCFGTFKALYVQVTCS